jgi:hypothetical protein
MVIGENVDLNRTEDVMFSYVDDREPTKRQSEREKIKTNCYVTNNVSA